jgi:two-component system cell cycle response regulator
MEKNKVLIVDDEQEVTNLIQEALQREGYATDVAYDGEAALVKFEKNKPDLVILDVNLPKVDGFTVCKKIKENKTFVPVIIVTGKLISVNDKIEGLKIGADDYLTKPFDIAELKARISAMSRLKNMYKELDLLNCHLAQLSIHDSLTEVYNRRYLIERMEAEIKRAIRAKSVISAMLIDLDDFKPLNDNYDHLFGDAILKKIAKFLKNNIRQTDILARYGGDEFFIITPDTNKKGTFVLASKLIKKIEKIYFKAQDIKVKVTISAGISSFNGRAVKGKFVSVQALRAMCKKLINDADKALYAAKDEGGNRACTL